MSTTTETPSSPQTEEPQASTDAQPAEPTGWGADETDRPETGGGMSDDRNGVQTW